MNGSPLKIDLRRLGWIFAASYFIVAFFLAGLFSYLNHVHQARLANSYALASRHSILIRDLRQAVSSLAPAVKAGFLSVAIRSSNGELVVGIPNTTATEVQRAPFILTIVESIYSNAQGGGAGHIANLEFSYSIRTPLLFSALGASILFALFGILFSRAKHYLDERHSLVVREKELETAQNLAWQVAHDIRSPLSALNMVISTIEDLPERKRLLIKNASQRINDIAVDLLKQVKDQRHGESEGRSSRKADSSPISTDPILLASLVDALVSEKRIQYRERMNLEIQTDLSRGYGLFACINRAELGRIISNLINNSIEAIEDSGKITVSLRAYPNECAIIVSDSGKGISPDILLRLGERGVTYGKENSDSGSGLGVHHAKSTIEAAGGRFLIQSKAGEGTIVTITLPRANAPSWFVEKISIPSGKVIVSIDDDLAIHQLWKERLRMPEIGSGDFRHQTFTSLDEFKRWYQENSANTGLILIAYEFIDQKENGLEVIECLKINSRAILMTSRFEDKNLQHRVVAAGAKLLPKVLVHLTPIEHTYQ